MHREERVLMLGKVIQFRLPILSAQSLKRDWIALKMKSFGSITAYAVIIQTLCSWDIAQIINKAVGEICINISREHRFPQQNCCCSLSCTFTADKKGIKGNQKIIKINYMVKIKVSKGKISVICGSCPIPLEREEDRVVIQVKKGTPHSFHIHCLKKLCEDIIKL